MFLNRLERPASHVFLRSIFYSTKPQNYDEKGRIKNRGKLQLAWKTSRGYLATQRRLSHQERKLAAQRKSLHGRLVNEIVRVGNTIHLEKASYKGWQKRYGKSVGLRAPGMLVEHLKRTVYDKKFVVDTVLKQRTHVRW